MRDWVINHLQIQLRKKNIINLFLLSILVYKQVNPVKINYDDTSHTSHGFTII